RRCEARSITPDGSSSADGLRVPCFAMASCAPQTVPAVTTLQHRIRPVAGPLAWLTLLLFVPAAAASAQSVFTTRPDDPGAVHLAAPEFAVRGDGAADDSAA